MKAQVDLGSETASVVYDAGEVDLDQMREAVRKIVTVPFLRRLLEGFRNCFKMFRAPRLP